MSREVNRKIIFYRSYFYNFYFKLDLKSKDKIKHRLDLVKYLEVIPMQYMKFIKGSNGIYEIRINIRNRSIRMMSLFDREDTVVILNCFIKKTQNVQRKEIEIAERLKHEYLNEKN